MPYTIYIPYMVDILHSAHEIYTPGTGAVTDAVLKLLETE